MPDITERVESMKKAGYEDVDIADVLGMSEAEVHKVLQGDIPERLQKLN